MKRVICCLVTCSVILLAGCTGNFTVVENIMVAEAGYTCHADVTYGERISAGLQLSVSGGGIFSAQLQTPKELEGLCFSFDNGKMTVSYRDLQAPAEFSGKYGGFAEKLNDVFLKITTGGPEVQKSGNGYSYQGEIDGSSFSMTFNEDGFPLTLSIPNALLTAEFSDWKY